MLILDDKKLQKDYETIGARVYWSRYDTESEKSLPKKSIETILGYHRTLQRNIQIKPFPSLVSN